jgi:hypothetical protein
MSVPTAEPLPDDFNLNSRYITDYSSVQTQNINSAVFGLLIMWAIWILYGSYHLWKTNKKRTIFILNLGQAIFYLFKILSAAMYVIFYKLNCSARSYLINLPQIVCYVLIYVILLKRLLRYAPFQLGSRKGIVIPKLAVKIIFSLMLISYVSVILSGVITSTSSLTPVGKCRTVYTIIYRQQYTVEMIIEPFMAILLILGLTKKSESNRHEAKNVFTQLREDENLRMFLVFIIITAKIILSYNNLNLGFDVLSFTHAIDSARSALIYWALRHEYNTYLSIEKAKIDKMIKSQNQLENSRVTNNGTQRVTVE